MKTGIIVARFQTSYLHEAHKKLIDYVQSKNERLIIFLGTTTTRLTINNPLDFESRKMMLIQEYPNAIILEIPDMKCDKEWSKTLDSKIFHTCDKEHEVTLYASRGGFIDWYHGEHKTEYIESIIIDGLSATDIRNAIHSKPTYTKDFREGIIFASAHKYPVSYQCVDIAVIDFYQKRILLGKKANEHKYRFVGGYVDTTDSSLEHSAKREVNEEITGIETSEYKYIGSRRVDDWRYRNSADKIMTSFFTCAYIFGNPKASDDIEEVKWFHLTELHEEMFEPEHIELFKLLANHLQPK